MIPTRLRAGAQWSDACILNISSRGMMIRSGRAGPAGSTVELRRGDYVIVAHVVWREGAHAGLRSDDRLPVDEIMSFCQSSSLRLVACEGAIVERRKQPRAMADDARQRGRLMEFVGVAAIAASLALGAWTLVETAFGQPMAKIQTALGGDSRQ